LRVDTFSQFPMAAASATTTTAMAAVVAATADRVKSANWNGSIPVVLSLAPSSLSSPTVPPPIHTLVARHTFLHIGLKSAVFRLQEYAPPTISFPTLMVGGGGGIGGTKVLVVEEPEPGQVSQDQEEKEREANESTALSPLDSQQHQQQPQLQEKKKDVVYPVCWFEDEASGVPLRWHLFAGILFDACSSTATAAWQQQQQQQNHQISTSSTAGESPNHSSDDGEVFLPWKIRLHFTSYPSTQLLELGGGAGGSGGDGVLTVVERSFKNSLKQALFLQHGNSKLAMNMTKQAHGQLWDSILTTNYSVYRHVNAEYLQPVPKQQQSNNNNNNNSTGSTVQLIPIRILVDSKPAIQKKCSAEQHGETLTLGGLLCQWVPEYFEQVVSVTTTTSTTSTTSDRIGHPDDDDAAADVANGESNEQVGTKDATSQTSPTDTTTTVVQSREGTSISWHVGGIVPPLSTRVMDLWRAMSHPDHFLYVVVTTKSNNM
jgi:Autophagy protein Apg5